MGKVEINRDRVTGPCPRLQIRETRQTMRDSETGMERMAIGHHIGERGHVMARSRNRNTGDHEERQDFINLEECESRSALAPAYSSTWAVFTAA